MFDEVLNVCGALLMLAGALLTLASAIGMVRFPDLLSRLHAASKPQSLGIICMMSGFALSMRSVHIAWTALLIVIFQLVTAPVSAHLAARAGYRTGQIDSRTLVTDEYKHDMARSLRMHRLRERQEKLRAAERQRETKRAHEARRSHEQRRS